MGYSFQPAQAAFAAALLSVMALGHSNAEATAANRYILNHAAGDILARHVPTDTESIVVANHCAEGGGQKETCLCLVKVLKYDLNMRDYRAIAARIRPDENAPKVLTKDRYNTPATLKPLDPILQTLLESPDLVSRCETADRYYAQQK